MPIDAQWASLYPEDWDQISLKVREEAGQRCEWCGLANGSEVEREGGKLTKIVLTVAHMDHDPRHCERANLKALCQKCHITYDKDPAQAARRRALRAELLHGQEVLL